MTKKAFTIVFFISFFLITAFGTLKYFNALRVDPDHLLWHSMGLSLNSDLNPENFFNDHLNYLKDKHATEETIYIARFRQEKDGNLNYIGGLVFLSLAEWISESLFGYTAQNQYNQFAASSFIIGFTLPVIIIFILIGIVVGLDKNPEAKIALLLTLIFILISDIIPSRHVPRFLSYELIDKGFFYIIREIAGFFLDTSISFSIFSFTIKSRLICLIMLAFYLRWKINISFSYLILLFGGLFHITYGGLILTLVFLLDLIRQPKVFKKWVVRVSLLAGFIIFAFGDVLSKRAFSALPLLHITTAIIIILLGFLLIFQQGYFKNNSLEYLHRARRKLDDLGPIKSDIFISLLIWLGTFIIVIPICLSIPALDNYHFWGQLHGRVLGLLQPSIVLGIFWLLVKKLRKTISLDCTLQYTSLFTAAAIVFFGIFAFRNLNPPFTVSNRIYNDFKKIESLSQKDLTKISGRERWISNEVFGYNPKTQRVIYYVFGKSLKTNEPLYTNLFKR